MTVYYNEHDPFAAAWLRELIKAGHIAPGTVDERSIEDVRPDELAGYTQCHFFAGIGGWSYALRFAGWPDDKPVWTGSCPCQPFSAAGKGGGTADERHLWPAWFHLIEQCKPDVIFGEQVEAAIKHGWLDLVQADLEGEGYACGVVGLPAACVGAPHIRQRLWFVADTTTQRCGETGASSGRSPQRTGDSSESGIMGNAEQPGLQEQYGLPGVSCRTPATEPGQTAERASASTFWSDADWLSCRDGKARPVEPGTFPLAHGLSGRAGRLRGYGNAIIPQVAAEMIKAYCLSSVE
jgi:DNA (cytosine-5)-methyltransferase 1